jgi:hypothetical protein
MRLDLHRSAVVVTLSRRNLLTLLHKLERGTSVCALVSGNAYRDRVEINDVQLVVTAEPDEQHYVRRDPPGEVHPLEEAHLALDGAVSGRPRNGAEREARSD